MTAGLGVQLIYSLSGDCQDALKWQQNATLSSGVSRVLRQKSWKAIDWHKKMENLVIEG